MIEVVPVQTSLLAEVISLGRLCPVVFEMLFSKFTVHFLHKATLVSLFIWVLSTEINFEEGEMKTCNNHLAGREQGTW